MNDLLLANAIAESIVAIDPPLVPTTTLKNAASAGDVALVLTDLSVAAQCVKGTRLHIWDGTAERTWAIRSADPLTGTVQLETRGLDRARVGPITGLQFAHDAGVTVTINLLRRQPIKIAAMLARGDPVVFVVAKDDSSRVKTERATMSTLTMHIEVRRSLLQDEADAMDDNDWSDQQEEATREDLQTIQDALVRNRHLNASNGANAQGIGDESGGPEMARAWGQLTVAADNQQFVGFLDVKVRARLRNF